MWTDMKYFKYSQYVVSEELVKTSFNAVQCSGSEKVNIFWLKLGLLSRTELIENVDYNN